MAKTKVTEVGGNSLTVIQSEYGDKLTKILNYKTTDKASYDKGAELLSIVNTATKKAEEEKKKVLDPAELTVKRIKEQWRPFEDKLRWATNIIKSEMGEWLRVEEDKINEKQRKLLLDKRISNPVTLNNKLASLELEPVSNTRSVLKLYIDDPSLIPREYLVVDESKVREALKEGIAVPGARLDREKIIVAG